MLREISTKKIIQIIASKKTFLICLLFGFFLYPDSALAAATYNSLVQIPLMPLNPNALDYLSGLNTFLISVVGLVAMGAIVIGGARYLTSAGNTSAIEDAKHTIYQAIWGLILALTSWVIISTINPDILVLKKPGVSISNSVFGFGAKTPQCALPGGDGKTCKCIDAKSGDETVAASFGTAPSSLTMSVAPATVVVGGGIVTVSGKLTDTATGLGIGGATLKMLLINSSLNAASFLTSSMCSWLGWFFGGCPNLTTAADGSFSFSTGSASCSSTEQWQIVFKGDPTYNASGSNIVDVTATGAPACTSATYMTSPAAFYFFDNNKDKLCQQVCSDPSMAQDSSYHCLKAKLSVGINQDQALSGNQTIVSPSNAKVGQPIYFDTITNSNIKNNPTIAGFAIYYNSTSWWNWLGPDYLYAYNTKLCGGTLGCQDPNGDNNWNFTPLPPCNIPGQFTHTYTAGNYTPKLRVGVMVPSDPGCAYIDDVNAIIEVK